MVQGREFTPKKQTVLDALKATGGNVTLAAEMLKCCKQTLYQWIWDYPDIKEEIERLREVAREVQLDQSEAVVSFAESMKEKDLTNALKAAMFKLNNLGSKRKYNHPDVAAVKENQKAIADTLTTIHIAPDSPSKASK